MRERAHPTSPSSRDARLLSAIRGAERDLERVRAALADAEGAAGSREALRVVAAHWREHKAAHGAVLRLVAEELREALLVELEGWKRQLRAQLDAAGEVREHTREATVDASLVQLRTRLANTEAGLDRAELLITLGELHASRQDAPEAEARLRSAEQELEPYRQRATGSAIADALVEALPGMVRGETRDLRTELEAVMRASQLLERVYEGLARVVEDTDEARRYLERRRDLQEGLAHGSQGEVDFKRKLLEELARQTGTT